MHEVIKVIDASLVLHENRARAVQMEAYMRNLFPFLGITSPKRKDIYRPIWHKFKPVIQDDWKAICKELWDSKYREHQMIAMLVLKSVEKNIVFDDLDLLLDFVQTKSWWDTVDFLAANSIGSIVFKNLERQEHLTKNWIADKNIWVQRVALIHQLKFRDKVNLDLLFYCVLKVKKSKEFFLQKGAGWALREASKNYPAEIEKFILNHDELPNLTKREGIRIINKKA